MKWLFCPSGSIGLYLRDVVGWGDGFLAKTTKGDDFVRGSGSGSGLGVLAVITYWTPVAWDDFLIQTMNVTWLLGEKNVNV